MKTKAFYILMAIGILVSSFSIGFNAYAEKEPIKIGFMGDFTGPLTEHSIAGKQGAILALEEANSEVAGRSIELIVEDDASKPAIAMDKVRKLVETDKVSLILGPFHGGCSGGVIGFVNRVKIPQILYWYSVGDYAQRKATWTWAPWGTHSQIGTAIGAYAYEILGYRTLAIMATDFVAGRGFTGGAVDAFKERGGKVIQEQWVPLGTKDVSPYITALKKADALSVWFMGVTVIPGFRQLREYKVKMPIIMPQSGHSTHPKIMAVMGDTSIGVITACTYAWTINTPENKKFVDAYQKRWGELPAGVAYGGYSSAQIVMAALEKTGGDTSPDALAKALDATEVPGILGTFRFGDARVGVVNYVIYNHAKVDSEIITDVLAQCTVASKRVGDKLVHSVVGKSW